MLGGVRTGKPVPDDVGAPPRAWTDVVELRFSGGLGADEAAEVLHASPLMRDWKSAKAWLYRELAGPPANGR